MYNQRIVFAKAPFCDNLCSISLCVYRTGVYSWVRYLACCTEDDNYSTCPGTTIVFEYDPDKPACYVDERSLDDIVYTCTEGSPLITNGYIIYKVCDGIDCLYNGISYGNSIHACTGHSEDGFCDY